VNVGGGQDFIARGNNVAGNIVADFPTGVLFQGNCAQKYTGNYTDGGGNQSNYPNCL